MRFAGLPATSACPGTVRVTTAPAPTIANVPTFMQERLEENLNREEDEKDWKWSELTRAINL